MPHPQIYSTLNMQRLLWCNTLWCTENSHWNWSQFGGIFFHSLSLSLSNELFCARTLCDVHSLFEFHNFIANGNCVRQTDTNVVRAVSWRPGDHTNSSSCRLDFYEFGRCVQCTLLRFRCVGNEICDSHIIQTVPGESVKENAISTYRRWLVRAK